MMDRYAVTVTYHDQTLVLVDSIEDFYNAKLLAFGYAAVHLRNFHAEDFVKAVSSTLPIPYVRVVPFEWQCPLCDCQVRIVHQGREVGERGTWQTDEVCVE